MQKKVKLTKRIMIQMMDTEINVVYPYKCAKREVKEASSLDVVFILGLK